MKGTLLPQFVHSKSLLEAALMYADSGWFVYPQQPRGKRPLIAGGRGYLDATTDTGTIRRWWTAEPNANIALAPGRSSLIVFDLDGPEAMAAAENLGISPTTTLSSVRGDPTRAHVYFRRPDEFKEIGNVRLLPNVLTLETRCDKGGITLPPSVHPSGATYRWNGETSDISELPAPALSAVYRAHALWTEGETARLAMPIDPATLTSEQIDRRVTGYLNRVGHVGIGARDSTAYQVAAFLVRDLALNEELALAYLASWNVGNQPPLGERDLKEKIRSASRSGRRPIGAGLVDRPTRPRPVPLGRAPRALGVVR